MRKNLLRCFIVLLAVMLLPISTVAHAGAADSGDTNGGNSARAFNIVPKFLHVYKPIQVVLPSEAVAANPKFPAVPYYNNDPSRYKITVDTTNNVCSIWERTGSTYSKLARRFLVTTGKSDSPTPTGSFKLDALRERRGGFAEFSDTVYYLTHIVRNIYFHSVLYTNRAGTVLDRAAFGNLGRSTSHGCIRMLVENCMWIYYNCPPGTAVNIFAGTYNSSAQSGLPKPSAGSYKVPSDPNPWPPTVYATATATVNARDGLMGGATMFKVNQGDRVQVLMYDGTYAKVTKNGGTTIGYMSANYLKLLPY